MKLLSCFWIAAALCCAATPEQADVVRHANAGPEDIIPLHTSTFVYSAIVLPEGEKAVSYLCGDPKHWDVQIIEGAERFVNVKPSPGAHGTDFQILTDHNHAYTVKAQVDTPVDVKLFLDSTDPESIRKPPSFIPVAEVQQLKSKAEQAQAEIERLKKQGQEQQDAYQSNYPRKLSFEYLFRHGEAPFNIAAVWHDDKFTYIQASPEETASFYELKDGKPNLVQADFHNGLYVVRDIVDRGYLQVGKKKTDIIRKPNS